MKIKYIPILVFYLAMCFSINAQQHKNDNRSPEFNVAPYFNYSTTIGAGFGLVPMYSFYVDKNDMQSPRSILGVVGYYTTNNSWAVVNFGSFFFDKDKWRIVYGIAIDNYNFQTYVQNQGSGDDFLDYATESDVITLDVKRKIFGKVYFGLGYTYQHSKTDFEGDLSDINTELNILKFEVFRDARDDINYPKNGSLLKLQFNHLPKWIGNSELSNVLIINYNRYIGVVDNRDIVALRFHTKSGLKNVHFQQQVVVGGVDLRGYSDGKYRGDGMLDIQGEYRWNFRNKLRLSAVGFAGLGTLYGSDTEDFNWSLYPSIGAGIRWTALTKSHINVGLDVGFGKDDWGIYFRFKEAF
ncbi:BamA/TamA family outer membrane protein [Tenacibaculum sp. UWU-22]|uniref:BamA/TamA family outer membrane protein n=1 Tax=Tenacibaculum sp. UWU-22 TaxID=3234187 RepID=UPI0034DB5EC3